MPRITASITATASEPKSVMPARAASNAPTTPDLTPWTTEDASSGRTPNRAPVRMRLSIGIWSSGAVPICGVGQQIVERGETRGATVQHEGIVLRVSIRAPRDDVEDERAEERGAGRLAIRDERQ